MKLPFLLYFLTFAGEKYIKDKRKIAAIISNAPGKRVS
ncbi:hypothetical protein AWRI1631_124820 [Saccharomyces cerevisiae AWRI1631]|jgi:hypothetical protein|uniref:Uncharacterized protein n=1 Tax=Saccharomyces cerevisiae (strain AWRI1631) TaxID=545124 RepID=B5VNZ1_YEAS6|nr:hypothetical protein AWRI1631_124820 [Saccharomyces cerevisiae AWRI1631]